MLHEPEFESPEADGAEDVVKTSSRAGRAVRGVFYAVALAMLGVAVGVQASPQFAATVGKSVPEPVAAAFASLTGDEAKLSSCNDGKCCSSMNRASLMTASTESGSCSSACAHEAASLVSADAGTCCSSQQSSALAAGECSGVCPLSAAAAEENLAVSLPAPVAESEAAESEAAESETNVEKAETEELEAEASTSEAGSETVDVSI